MTASLQTLKNVIFTFSRGIFLQMISHRIARKREREGSGERDKKRSSIRIAFATHVVSVTILISVVHRSCHYSATRDCSLTGLRLNV